MKLRQVLVQCWYGYSPIMGSDTYAVELSLIRTEYLHMWLLVDRLEP